MVPCCARASKRRETKRNIPRESRLRRKTQKEDAKEQGVFRDVQGNPSGLHSRAFTRKVGQGGRVQLTEWTDHRATHEKVGVLQAKKTGGRAKRSGRHISRGKVPVTATNAKNTPELPMATTLRLRSPKLTQKMCCKGTRGSKLPLGKEPFYHQSRGTPPTGAGRRHPEQ